MVFERTRIIRGNEVDFNGAWRIASVWSEMQELAELHGNELNVGGKALEELGLFWVISRICVQIRAYPTWGEEIIGQTWPRNMGNRIFPRYFRFIRPDGEELGVACAIFLLMDRANMRVIRAPKSLIVPDFCVENGRKAELISGRLIPEEGALKEAGRRRPRYSDLDVNRHMNNERYVEWILDLFEPERFEKQRVKTLQINYLSEAKANDEIVLGVKEDGDHSWIRGMQAGTDQTVFEAMCVWL